jgi:hypothetical protein
MFRDDDTIVDVASVILPSSGGDGQTALANTNVTALTTTTPCTAVFVQADSANTTNMRVGVTATPKVVLTPGQGIWIAISDLATVRVQMVSGTGNANYLYLA